MLRRPTAEDLARFRSRALPVKSTRKPKLPTTSEADLQATCCGLLIADGWRIVTTDPKWMRGLGVSEKGIADTLAIRYPRFINGHWAHEGQICLLWIEWKKISGKYAQDQHDWHTIERARGGTTWKAEEDFVPTIEGFAAHYNSSGFAINRMRVGAQLR